MQYIVSAVSLPASCNGAALSPPMHPHCSWLPMNLRMAPGMSYWGLPQGACYCYAQHQALQMKQLPALHLSQPRPPCADFAYFCCSPVDTLLLAPFPDPQGLMICPAASAVGPKRAAAAQRADQTYPKPWTVEALHCASPEGRGAEAYEHSYITMRITASSPNR